MERKEVEEILQEALELLKEHDSYLFRVDANERSFTHKLAGYLQAGFQTRNLELHVDCEYNRSQGDHKKLILEQEIRNRLSKVLEESGGLPGYDDTNAKTVYPDIIVHKRGDNENNLLVIEVKKSTNQQSTGETDKKKLDAFLESPFNYQHAVFIQLIVGGEKDPDWECKWAPFDTPSLCLEVSESP
ncbi:hypothetical protein [Thermoleptolyngbya sp. M55_K2018_002]|uniref:hypothetical protein n=1 Tax=Thermoleptolyngbya sp. M55_K2018_002 TaxID=2747808 RepID=UPI0019F340F5|nr:hypothetical protein [Thermoleptolyngbya sp. M55_K2018_002]HIK41546.1 hypothetical protein [Thermoleptolyngbya sp. M55_K2018_002]